jgi:DivIVA domain-containing protein
MIDLTPLDVRKKKGDFAKSFRGYDPAEVDHFLELVAERLEELVRENLTLKERASRLEERVQGQDGRERAVQEALVTAQSLREEIREQARREAALIHREAEAAADEVRGATERFLQARREDLRDLQRGRDRFLRGIRTLLEREFHALEAEEANPPPAEFERSSPSGAGTTSGDSGRGLEGGSKEGAEGGGDEGELETGEGRME